MKMIARNKQLLENFLNLIQTLESPLRLREICHRLGCSRKRLIILLQRQNIIIDESLYRFKTYCIECNIEIPFHKEFCSHECRCRNTLRLSIEEITHKLKQRNIIFLENYTSNLNKLLCKCVVCGHQWYGTPASIFAGGGCPICNKSGKFDMFQFKQLCDKYAPDWIILDDEYIAKTKINIKCKHCGSIRKAGHQLLRSGQVYCQICKSRSKSFPELEIEKFLTTNKISFTLQKKFKGLEGKKKKSLRFDFYLNDFNILIEYDGEGHFKEDYIYNKGKLDHTYDIAKHNYCNTNKIRLIRIPFYVRGKLEEYLEFIKEECFEFKSEILTNYYGKEYEYLTGKL